MCHHRYWTATLSCQAHVRIEAGEYIDIIELLPDQLGTTSPFNDDLVKAGHQWRRALSGILEWVQCFETYMALCCWKQLHCIQDLLGYQTLIMEPSLEYQGDGWLGYDWQFQQRAATNHTLVCVNIDSYHPMESSLCRAG